MRSTRVHPKYLLPNSQQGIPPYQQEPMNTKERRLVSITILWYQSHLKPHLEDYLTVGMPVSM